MDNTNTTHLTMKYVRTKTRKILKDLGMEISGTQKIGGRQFVKHGWTVSRVNGADRLWLYHTDCVAYSSSEYERVREYAITALRLDGLPYSDRGGIECDQPRLDIRSDKPEDIFSLSVEENNRIEDEARAVNVLVDEEETDEFINEFVTVNITAINAIGSPTTTQLWINTAKDDVGEQAMEWLIERCNRTDNQFGGGLIVAFIKYGDAPLEEIRFDGKK